MCLSAKSSCLGNILSICLEETAADVLRPRAAVVMDAPRFRILHWSFQTTRVLSLRCLHGALGFTDLAKKIPQDLAQLCISKSLRKTSLQKNKTNCWRLVLPSLGRVSPTETDAIPAGDSANSFKTAEFIQLHSCTRADQSERRRCVTQWGVRSNSC